MTVASMTGFARAAGRLSGRVEAALVVRSVNHRYLDVTVRHDGRGEAPELEAAVRAEVARRLRRGRVIVEVRLRWAPGVVPPVELDGAALAALAAGLAGLEVPEGVEPSVRLGELVALPGVVRVPEEEPQLEPGELEALRGVTGAALEALVAMRRREGAALAAQVAAELERLEEFAGWLRPMAGEIVAGQVARLRERIAALLEGMAEADEARLLQEAGLLAERADVEEEIVRLEAHVAEARGRLERGGEVGKALDFLCQEMLRELNTIGAKLRDAAVVARLVDAKGAVERLREQVQNLE